MEMCCSKKSLLGSCYQALSDHWIASSASNSLTIVILREGVKNRFCPPPPFTDVSQKVVLSKLLKMVFLDKRHLLLTSFLTYGQNSAQYLTPPPFGSSSNTNLRSCPLPSSLLDKKSGVFVNKLCFSLFWSIVSIFGPFLTHSALYGRKTAFLALRWDFSVSNDNTAKKETVYTKKKKQDYLTIWDTYHCSKYEEKYFSFFSAVCQDIFNETGCPPPCSHWKYG